MNAGFIEDYIKYSLLKRAVGAEFVSPALQRGEDGFQKFVTESRRDVAKAAQSGPRTPPPLL